jgi:hypothetical protein
MSFQGTLSFKSVLIFVTSHPLCPSTCTDATLSRVDFTLLLAEHTSKGERGDPGTMAIMSVWSAQAILLLLVPSYFIYAKWRRKTYPLPPGPKGWPIIGNALDIPLTSMGPVYASWAKLFGEIMILLTGDLVLTSPIGSSIISASALGQTIIIIDSYDVAIELLEKRAAKYSSRRVVDLCPTSLYPY